MNQREILKSLSENNRIILIGEETYRMGQILDTLKKSLHPDFMRLNFIEIDQRATDLDECLLKLEAVPMMDDKKLVHIHDFNFAIDGNTWSKKELKSFEEHMNALSPDTICVLSNGSVNKVGTSRLLKDWSKTMNLIQLDRMNQKELTDFLEDHFTDGLGSSPSKEVIVALIQSSGYLQKGSEVSLYHLIGMASKLEALYRENHRITIRDIENLFTPPEEGDIFRLIDAIVGNKKETAFAQYHALREMGEANIKIFVTVGKILSTAVRSSYYFEEGHDVDAVASVLKKSPFAIRSAKSTWKKLGRRKLIEILEIILDVDYRMKTGYLDESTYGEMILVRIFDCIKG